MHDRVKVKPLYNSCLCYLKTKAFCTEKFQTELKLNFPHYAELVLVHYLPRAQITPTCKLQFHTDFSIYNSVSDILKQTSGSLHKILTMWYTF